MNSIMFGDMEDICKRKEGWDWLIDTNVLITGAYGMLASYLVLFFCYLNDNVLNNSIQIYAQGRNPDKMQIRYGEYCNKPYFHAVYDDICEDFDLKVPFDYIIHAASPASSQYYGTNPLSVIKPNVFGTYNILRCAQNDRCKKVLYFSTGDVYGKIGDSVEVVTESDYGYVDPTDVRSCYGESKRMAENLLSVFHYQFGVPTVSVRICHTYGPTMDLENDKRVFAEFVKSVIEGTDIVIKSDGSAKRSFCYLADAADAFLRLLKDGAPGEAYNMCNNAGSVSISELAELLENKYGDEGLKVRYDMSERGKEYLESPVKVTKRYDVNKLEKLGWNPVYSVEKGFERTVRAFREEKLEAQCEVKYK